MKWGYIVLEFKFKICKLCVVWLDILISLDFIVGFLGEIEVDFEKIMQLIEDIGFDQSFLFIYLCCFGILVVDLEDMISDVEKYVCLLCLQVWINVQVVVIFEKMVGMVQIVLVEGLFKCNLDELIGKSENMCLVNFVGYLCLIGQFVDVEIIEVYSNLLCGWMVVV